MNGGKVIETIVLDNRVWLNCQEEHSENTCAVYVALTASARCVSERDSIRWDQTHCYWTARERIGGRVIGKADFPLRLIGGAGAARPILEPRAVESGVAPAAPL